MKKSPINFRAKVRAPDGVSMDVVMSDVAEGIELCFCVVPLNKQAELLAKLSASYERRKAEQTTRTE